MNGLESMMRLVECVVNERTPFSSLSHIFFSFAKSAENAVFVATSKRIRTRKTDVNDLARATNTIEITRLLEVDKSCWFQFEWTGR